MEKENTNLDQFDNEIVNTELEKLNLTPEQIEAVKKIIDEKVAEGINKAVDNDKSAEKIIDSMPKPKKSEADIAYETRLSELDAKEKELAGKEKSYLVRDALMNNNLPPELANYITITAEQDVESVVAEFVKILGEYIGNQKLKDNYKPNNSNNKPEAITREQFKRMNYIDRHKLNETNPELYKRLSK